MTELDLPTELLEKILSQLTLRDNIRASAVCRRWNAVATSVRVADKAPWLMVPPPHKSGDLYEFYDPSQHQSYFLEFPELRGSRFSYTKDGWLLMYNHNTNCVFFFCPYTRELIKLPKLGLPCHIAAFSASPKCPSCVIFTLEDVSRTVVAISTCRPGATQWTTVTYQNQHQFPSCIWNKIVFCRDIFCCLNRNGFLGVYNPEKGTWVVHPTDHPPNFLKNSYSHIWLRGKFMAEHNGDIFLIHTSGKNPVVFKLDETNKVWVEMENLGGTTIFVNFLCSHVRTDLLGLMRNSVYFPRVLFDGQPCVSYSFDDGRYYPLNQSHDLKRQRPFDSIWIEAPEDLSTFSESCCPPDKSNDEEDN
ncbi:hypothetical protein BUALT_Bualt11G0097600 [Buddleja alternifolia]|uniref:F-box domain-containing protein n=1 Tax=Buddleja alternifolia TaxID=168488 RepID=A0AAV6X2C7_9LAMI|nr:hypothetical protein BUALT_Bualt11G0097600 [Buddleja alternifolia]